MNLNMNMILRYEYGQKVTDTLTSFTGVITGCAYYFNKRQTMYLVESVDSTGRPIEEWIEENRLS